MKALISFCILLAGASLAGAQTTKPSGYPALDKCAAQYGLLPCQAALIRQAEKSTADLFDGGVAKREKFIKQMGDRFFAAGLMSDWLVIVFPEAKTVNALSVEKLQDPDSEQSTAIANQQKVLSPLGFKGMIALLGSSGDCLVVPFVDPARAHLEQCKQINFSALTAP